MSKPYLPSVLATMSMIDIVKQTNIFGREDADDLLIAQAKAFGCSALNFSWEQSWGVNARLRVSFETEDGAIFTINPTISWSATARDTDSARAAVALYSAVTDLAILIKTVMAGYTITKA